MFAVKGVYEGGAVVISEPVLIKDTCEVIVTFLSPAEQGAAFDKTPGLKNPGTLTLEEKREALRQLTGIAAGNTMSLDEVSLESAFGLWKDRNITQETLREKAWMKN